MKKSILLFVSLLITVILAGQSKYKFAENLWVHKTAPALLLDGSGGIINFNNGDILLTQSANKLSMTGGVFDFSVLPTVNGASLSALYTAGNISIGVNSLLLTGSIAATGNRVTKGWFTDIESTNPPSIGGVSMAQVMTVTKTIGGVGVAACDFNFTTAANQTPQPIDLGAIIPAKARITNVQTFTNNVFTGAVSLAAITGVTTGDNSLITTATIYAGNAITATATGGSPYTVPSASATHVWLTATPGANWSLVTAGKVTVSVTYVAY